jgi:hypothetical protein
MTGWPRDHRRDERWFVMAGLVPAIYAFFVAKTWMPGTRPGMTNEWLWFEADYCAACAASSVG